MSLAAGKLKCPSQVSHKEGVGFLICICCFNKKSKHFLCLLGLSVGNMFYVFSDEGITMLQPSECEIRKHMKRTERIVATYVSACRFNGGATSIKTKSSHQLMSQVAV